MSSRKKRGFTAPNDLGLGTKVVSLQRFIRKDGSFNVTRVGVKTWAPYQSLVESSWKQLIVTVVIYYIFINLFFALCFVGIGVESISGIEPKGFGDNLASAFYFSVQTFTTVGYGSLNPITMASNLLAGFIAFIGLLSFAIATSLIYARFSKPKAQIIFSEKAVICNYRKGKALMFRIVNRRNHKIIDLKTAVFASWIDRKKGTPRRNFRNLGLERTQIFLFPSNWTIVHPITEESLLFGKTKEELRRINLEIIVQVKGYDESYNQTIHSNSSYIAEEMIWGERFKSMVTADEEGTVVHVDQIDWTEEDL
ncbi:MAG: ion channel [Saprospiraceae bacterium]